MCIRDSYITELRYHMKEYELDITAKHGVGIRMEGDQSAVKLLQKSIQRTAGDSLTSECRRKKIMEKLLMLDESISVRRLSDEFCISSTSVSYTHLDVYKRQVFNAALNIFFRKTTISS